MPTKVAKERSSSCLVYACQLTDRRHQPPFTERLSGTIKGGPLLMAMLGITAVSVVTVTEADVIMTGVLYAAIFVGGDQSTVQLSNCR